MEGVNLEWARKAVKNLGLDPRHQPLRNFGTKSAYGKIFELNGGRVMKVMPWGPNAEREMRVARIAGQANIGPKVYNTRQFGSWAVMTMDKVLNAKTLNNALRTGLVTNFNNVERAISKLHAAGIHHGNLHGDNILVYKNANGRWRFVPINFGAANYNTSVTNIASAVNSVRRKAKGTRRIMGINHFNINGRTQPVRSNANRLKALRLHYSPRSPVTPPAGNAPPVLPSLSPANWPAS